jgi:cation diffusion facilitator family transporter
VTDSARHAPLASRARSISRVLWLTLGLNWAVAAGKILFGWLTGSLMIMADGFHSISDGASNIVGLIAIRIAGRPADREHPYGHHKFETLAAFIISIFLLLTALGILRQAVLHLAHVARAPVIGPASFVVMGVTLGVNLFVATYERRKGKELKSEFLINDSWHTLTDIFVTASVLAGLVGLRLGWPWLDPVFAIGISGIILFTAARIGLKGARVLVDRASVDPEAIERVVRRIEGVRDCHRIRTRGRDENIHVDLHVLVDPHLTVEAAHRLSNLIERDIRDGIPGIHDVVVHIEPTTHDHEELGGDANSDH